MLPARYVKAFKVFFSNINPNLHWWISSTRLNQMIPRWQTFLERTEDYKKQKFKSSPHRFCKLHLIHMKHKKHFLCLPRLGNRCVCVCVCMYIQCIYIYIYIYIYTHTHTHTHLFPRRIYTHTHTHTHTPISKMHRKWCVCIYIYIYIYTHSADPRLLGALCKTVSGGGGGGVLGWMRHICPCFTLSRIALTESARGAVSVPRLV